MKRRLKTALLLLGLALFTYFSYMIYRAEQWNGYMGHGTFLYGQGRYNLAINQWQQAIRLIPSNVYAHYLIGNAYYKQGKLNEAMTEYQMYLRSRPDNARAYLGMGDILRDEGKHERSVAQYKKAIKIDPTLKLSRPDLGSYQ